MSVLVVAEIAPEENKLKKVSLETASAGRALGGPVTALLFNGTEEHAGQLFAAGADIVVQASLESYSPQEYAETVAEVARSKNAKITLLPHSAFGKDIAGRIAVKLQATVAADVTGLTGSLDEVQAHKPIYSGKAYANLKIKSPAVLTVRPNSLEVTEYADSPKTLESVESASDSGAARLTDVEKSAGDKVQLQDASIIVSGGRGIKGPDNWSILQELCDVLGAALGASRAAVDAGWISHSHQVGQTGKTVAPNCYIACGISGAIQHLAGMGSSRYIVAVNKDPDAPIFKVATYGIVGDLFEVVPAITAEFKKQLG